MALKALIIRSKLDKLRGKLAKLTELDKQFEAREEELETAISEMDEDTSDEDRQEVEDQAEAHAAEKEQNDQEKEDLEKAIEQLEEELEQEERKSEQFTKEREDGHSEEKRDERRIEGMGTKREFFGMNAMEQGAFFAREDVKKFLGEVRTAIKEKRAINNVGLTIPEVMLDMLRQRAEESSKLMKYVRLIPLNGTSRQNIMGTIPEAIWTEMTATINELTIGFNDVEMDGFKVSGFFAVANAIVEDSDLNLTMELMNALGRAIGKAIDKAIIYGKGSANKMPIGFVTRLAETSEPSGRPSTARTWIDLHTNNVITISGKTGTALFQEILKATKAVVNDYSAAGLTWVMNEKTRIDLLVQSMGTNNAAAIVAGMGNTMPVIGGQIETLNFMADGDIAFGYFDLYTLAERKGTQIEQSKEYRFIEDQTVIKGTARYDGLPVIDEAFGILNIAGSAPTTTATFAGE